MSTVGPSLPPHLSKRKRSSDPDSDSDSPGPAPPHIRSDVGSNSESTSQKRRVLGPSLPPAPLSERPSSPPTPTPNPKQDSSSDDDDFGPSLPSASTTSHNNHQSATTQSSTSSPPSQSASKPPQREDWMLVPPTSSDWTSRIDPTKLRNRKFQTGKGAKAPPPPSSGGGGIGSTWTETPDQKRQRLADEAMGVRKPAQLATSSESNHTDALQQDKKSQAEAEERKETERRIREYNEKHRGGSLYEAHSKQGPRDKDDDPSARAFDREKDIAGGMKIGHRARKDMMERAKGMGDRFAKGSYL